MSKEKIKFYREKNALSLSEKYEVTEPTESELFILLLNKFEEKIDMFKFGFDREKTISYLQNKIKKTNNSEKRQAFSRALENFENNKPVPKKLQQLVMKRTLIDIAQLEKDIFKMVGYNPGMTYKRSAKFTSSRPFDMNGVISEMKSLLEQFKLKADPMAMSKIMRLSNEIAEHYEIDQKEIKQQRAEIQDKEGSFLNGKLVNYSKELNKETPQNS